MGNGAERVAKEWEAARSNAALRSRSRVPLAR
jgi:hypothetical protein